MFSNPCVQMELNIQNVCFHLKGVLETNVHKPLFF